jgi:sulfur carrier protein
VTVVVNGEPREQPAGATVAEVVASLRAPTPGSAVALNGEVLPQREWTVRELADGDRLEVLTAVQGG